MSPSIIVYSLVKLSKKPWYDISNLGPILFFGSLITLGYLSVISTTYMLATGKNYLGDRPDILVKQ